MAGDAQDISMESNSTSATAAEEERPWSMAGDGVVYQKVRRSFLSRTGSCISCTALCQTHKGEGSGQRASVQVAIGLQKGQGRGRKHVHVRRAILPAAGGGVLYLLPAAWLWAAFAPCSYSIAAWLHCLCVVPSCLARPYTSSSAAVTSHRLKSPLRSVH
jgi:hypothetical protein